MKKILNLNLIKEYVLFNITGTFIFMTCQIFYTLLLFRNNINYIEAFVACTILSATLNFTLNSILTFKSRDLSSVKFAKIVLIQFFEFMPNSIILIILVEVIRFPEVLAPMVCPIIMTPLMFFLSRKILSRNISLQKRTKDNQGNEGVAQ